MPRYGYKCPSCDERFDLWRPMSQAAEGATCPNCGYDARRTYETTGKEIYRSRNWEEPMDSPAYWDFSDSGRPGE
jgi:putative FmdB family regulatory protein